MITRPAIPADAPDMTALLNEIIAIGGTTAYTTPLTEEQVLRDYITRESLISSHVAEADDRVVGFQWLRWADPECDGMPKGWAIIASFVATSAAGKGIGKHLFAATATSATKAGVTTIDATIRGDNTSGLRYYSGLGFEDYDRLTDIELSDGTVVDKVRKRFEIS
ncbi:L-amino acid N-acyltransferase YncA [Yoonia maricola]|uniref:L-amino acid N-acyltransferase YncA n=1 Tax=Yoonia maricola TaxID=420999 RepID=A0A2M8W4E6_9RHOB|nr:GNAT family N-acetyltransferase [Yoonia maricola]PJI85790.1 L-amino acid N-acyltransferase YncA [Yoonia maricola]